MKTNCTRYDPNTGNCKLTNSQAECGYDCAGYSYIPDSFSPNKLASKTPENYNKATFYNELVEKLDEQRNQTGGNYAR